MSDYAFMLEMQLNEVKMLEQELAEALLKIESLEKELGELRAGYRNNPFPRDHLASDNS
jgi:hypothetical protein